MKTLESIVKIVAVLSGFYVIVLCLQPRDGGINGGISGIGGWSAIITAAFIISVFFVWYRNITEIDDLKHRLKEKDLDS